jgi:glycosyltransferase involved in cell wall biosynthesis
MLADALIMPFVKSELVLAVNPVKAYEYIASGKPVILTKYKETEKFEDFSYLYDGFADLNLLMLEISQGTLKARRSIEECRAFGNDNTWENRAKNFAKTLHTILDSPKDMNTKLQLD